MNGETGCTRGLPSAREVARYAILSSILLLPNAANSGAASANRLQLFSLICANGRAPSFQQNYVSPHSVQLPKLFSQPHFAETAPLMNLPTRRVLCQYPRLQSPYARALGLFD